MLVPGGVDRTGEYRVIPGILSLIRQLAAQHEVHVFTRRQEPKPGRWKLHGATIINPGERAPGRRLYLSMRAEHRLHRFDVMHCMWSGNLGLFGVACSTALRVPNLIHVAGGELVSLRDIGYGGRCTWKGRLREAAVLRLTGAVTTASRPMIDSLQALGIRAERVPLGVDLEFWSPRNPEPRLPRQVVRLIHVASLNRVKDQTTLLHALAIVAHQGQEFHLDIVGEDTLGGQIQSLCRELGLTRRVAFHGFLTQTELRPLLCAAHLLVMSSRHEAGPVVALEAAACGVPTVGTRVGHIAEWAPEAAIAVPIADPQALAKAVLNVCRDEGLRLRMAHQVQQLAVSQDARYTADRFLEIYDRLRQKH